jgi:Domain of unknown function (DUF4333)
MKYLPRCAAGAAATVSAMLLAACGTTTVTGPGLEAKMKSEGLAPKGVTNATVQCPAETEVKVGATVECSVTADKNKGKITARFADDQGGLTDYQADVDKILIANLEKNIEEQESNITGVACPSNIKPKAGGRYVCFGTISGSGLGKIAVTQTSEDGSVTVSAQKRKLRTNHIEQNITKAVKKRGINAQVDCPNTVTSQKGSVFRCKVRNPANGREITIVATQKDSAGNFDLKVEN